MQVERIDEIRTADGKKLPGYLLLPERPVGGAALCHGYGGSKEEMLGLGVRVAETAVAALCFDLRGHGEHQAPLGPGMLDDFEAAIAYLRRYGRVAAIGHSLGGRLALLTSADVVACVSPAVAARPSEEGKQMLVHFRSTTVNAAHPAQILELLRALPGVEKREGDTLLLYARGDIPSLVEGILGLKETLPGAELVEIGTHQHAEAPLLPSVLPYLPHWFNHLDLKANAEVLECVPQWVRQRLGGRWRAAWGGTRGETTGGRRS